MPRDELVADVARFLDRLQTTQDELRDLYVRKHTALIRARADELVRLAQDESRLAQRFEELLSERRELLRRSGRAVPTLHELAARCEEPDAGYLIARVSAARENAARLRQESWIHWIIAQRAFQHTTEIIELIANRGQRAATYCDGRAPESGGGAILDASA